MSREVLRQRINVISQDLSWIPSESIRSNLDLWAESTAAREDDELIEVMSGSQVWEHVKVRGGSYPRPTVVFENFTNFKAHD